MSKPFVHDKPAIRIAGVTFVYPGSEQPVLNEASLHIRRGSFTAIIGGNGCGKSTLCKLFNGLIPHYYSGDFTGTVEICGVSAENRTVSELSRMVGYVYQDFDNQLVRPTVMDEANFAPLNYGLPDYRALGARALDMCGLTHLKERYIWELSGGQKHLLALAGALSLEPDILVVDEPVSQLDPQHARQVYDVLRQLNQVHGKTIIVIEHHTEYIADYCEEVCLMEQGKVLWQRPVVQALNSLEDLERLGIQPPQVTKAAVQLSAILLNGGMAPDSPQDGHSITVGSGSHSMGLSGYRLKQPYPITAEEAEVYFGELMHRHTDTPLLLDHTPTGARADDASPADTTVKNPDSDQHSPQQEHETERQMEHSTLVYFNRSVLRYRTIHKAEHEVLRGIDLRLYEGERIALVGNNGAGKSSLLKLIAGIAKPSDGSVSIMGRNTKDLSMEQISANVAYVFQNPEDMFIEDNVYKEVAYGLKSRRHPEAEDRVHRMLTHFRLEPLKERDARLLSGGQQRRVSLAIGAAMMPRLILLDEPTANLDMSTREELLNTLQELEGHVRTVIIATHDMQLVHEWATRVIVLNQGVVAGDGTVSEIFADSELISRAGLAPTQMMDLSTRLGAMPPTSSPAEFAQYMYRILSGKELHHHAVSPQLV
ncbi:ABC transporter ATP-binding protein [Paenibacillus lautus]|uniref:ABC transporter ATP-binding protein n=1 Tax=Paenibacillus lautus TaxID=1401 RepID=UPI001C7D8B41|nr:ABC transporter ATP-binding protein [Paenibacillus lautus]MBX4151376.1 energy-coupling factor ABC transporter ATP-binding protein [Paenibacillus lautus]